jgi:hypothetical protein
VFADVGGDEQSIMLVLKRLNSSSASSINDGLVMIEGIAVRWFLHSLDPLVFRPPVAPIGDVVAGLARAGVFRLRSVLVGTVAYQSYPAILGVELSKLASVGMRVQ